MSAVLNFNAIVSCGSHDQTSAVTIVNHIGNPQGEASSDAVDDVAAAVLSRPNLDSGQRRSAGGLAGSA
jgi:hypothetical protein